MIDKSTIVCPAYFAATLVSRGQSIESKARARWCGSGYRSSDIGRARLTDLLSIVALTITASSFYARRSHTDPFSSQRYLSLPRLEAAA